MTTKTIQTSSNDPKHFNLTKTNERVTYKYVRSARAYGFTKKTRVLWLDEDGGAWVQNDGYFVPVARYEEGVYFTDSRRQYGFEARG